MTVVVFKIKIVNYLDI